MSPLNRYSENQLHQMGALATAQEIMQQPDLWQDAANKIMEQAPGIRAFLKPILALPNLRIILTGAGSSAFVGQSVAAFLKQHLAIQCEAVATTDLVSHPHHAFSSPASHGDCSPALLVSFARSGNSPESVAAINLADQVTQNSIYHLVITCNGNGELAQATLNNQRALCLLMPEAANDQGFAMTGSLTSMYLSAMMAFEQAVTPMVHGATHVKVPSITPQAVTMISNATGHLMATQYDAVAKLAQMPFDRCIWLGSAGFKALAEEASLKLLELTAGQVMSTHNSPLGFRHGPKSAVNQKTMTFFCLSHDTYAQQYDLDLIREMQGDNVAMQLVLIAPSHSVSSSFEPHDATTHFSVDCQPIAMIDALNYLPYLVIAQIFAFEKALHLGISPDNPCPSGMVNRVVQGVTIHPFETGSN